MERHEYWRKIYRGRRYLKNATDEEVRQRAKDILNNLTNVTKEGKIGFPSVDDEGRYWLKIWTEILEEFDIRGIDYRDGTFKDTVTAEPSWPNLPKGLIARKGR